MCSTKTKLQKSSSINGRAVLQPNSNRAPLLERCNSIIPLINNPSSATINASPVTINRSISAHFHQPPPPYKSKSKTAAAAADHILPSSSSSFKYAPSAIIEAPGSIAAARREQVANVQEQRKLRIAHYGRTTSSSKSKPEEGDHHCSSLPINGTFNQDKRCSFITPNSGS